MLKRLTMLFIALGFSLSFCAHAGVMNSIHLEAHESLSWFFSKRGEDFVGAYDMNFTSNEVGCTFTIATRAVVTNANYQHTSYNCKICFVQAGRRSFDAKSIDCQE